MESPYRKSSIGLALRGMAMGIAEVIPGVSGGTIAFITGIYETLLATIKSVNFDIFTLLKSGDWTGLWNHLNGRFLFFLLMGMGFGVVIGVFGVSHLLENYPEPLWGFFFGLVLASGIYMARQITGFKPIYVLLFLAGIILSYLITTLTPAGGSESLLFVFISGAIAISALILPGISGSFILLLMGMYSVIIPNVKGLLSSPNSESLVIVGVFAVGCLCGLMTFSRVLSYTFKHFKDATLAALTGIMIGSLPKIWPWRNPMLVLDKASENVMSPDLTNFTISDLEHVKILKEANVFPGEYFASANTAITIVVMVLGFVLILGVDMYQRRGNIAI